MASEALPAAYWIARMRRFYELAKTIPDAFDAGGRPEANKVLLDLYVMVEAAEADGYAIATEESVGPND